MSCVHGQFDNIYMKFNRLWWPLHNFQAKFKVCVSSGLKIHRDCHYITNVFVYVQRQQACSTGQSPQHARFVTQNFSWEHVHKRWSFKILLKHCVIVFLSRFTKFIKKCTRMYCFAILYCTFHHT